MPLPFCFRLSAFTLVELLTVIAVIGILAAILIPVVGRVSSAAKNSQCLSNVRQISLACLSYGSEHKNSIPEPWTSANPVTWQTRVTPYIGLTNATQLRQAFNCPAADPQPVAGTGQTTYALNRFLRASPVNGKYNLVPSPSRLVLIADVGASGAGTDETFPWNQATTTEAQREQQHRHNDKRTVAMVDGSARSLSRVEGGSYTGASRDSSLWATADMSYSGNGFSPSPATP